MIALHGYDPSFVEDGYFRSFVQDLNPDFEVPSRRDIEEMCDAIFDEERRDFLDKLRRAPGRLSLAVGKAETPEAGEVTYIACHFIDDEWKLHKMVMDACVPEGRHCADDGAILGFNVVCDVADYVIDAIFDDPSEMLSTMAYVMTDDGIHPRVKDYRSNCYASFTPTTCVDNMLHSIARCLVPDRGYPVGMFEDMPRLDLTRQERLQLLSDLDLDYEWAYDQQWCACYHSLQVLVKRGIINDADLPVKLLCKVWGQLYRAIQRISASICPTSHLCLPELFKLRESLQSQLDDDHADIDENDYLCIGNSIIDVLREAIDSLDKAIKDSYLVWSVPLALDPRYKLKYIKFSFKREFGSEAPKYISEVMTKINNLYAGYVDQYGTITGADHSDSANAMATTSADPLEQAWNEHRRSQDAMAAQANNCNPETKTDLDRYLKDGLAPPTESLDILSWWKVHSSEYPIVARMARDALAMPTCNKLSPNHLAQVKGILRGYSKKPYGDIFLLHDIP